MARYQPYLERLEHQERRKTEYSNLTLHIVVAHYKRDADGISSLLDTIFSIPFLGAMRRTVHLMSKAKDQAGPQNACVRLPTTPPGLQYLSC